MFAPVVDAVLRALWPGAVLARGRLFGSGRGAPSPFTRNQLEQAQFAERFYQFAGAALPACGEFDVVGIQAGEPPVATVGRGPEPQAQEAEHAFRAKAAAQFLQFGVLEKVELDADVDVHAFSLVLARRYLCAARASYFYKCK
jgi:hypothetical protein